MSHRSRLQACALPLVLAGLVAPTLAQATPSSRPYALDFAGNPVQATALVGLASDGGEVLFRGPSAGGDVTLSRNLRTNTTTTVLAPADVPRSASSDLNLVLFETDRSLDPADTNGTGDFYVLNRTTGKSTLVSRAATGASGVAGDGSSGFVSGDGKTLVYDDQDAGSPVVRRYDVATGTISLVGPGTLAAHQRIGASGRAIVTSNGIVADGKTYPVPANTDPFHDHRRFVASPDGFTVIEQATVLGSQNVVRNDLRTGARTTVPTSLYVLGVANGGATVTVVDAVEGSDHQQHAVIEHVAVGSGAVSQVGQVLPDSSASPAYVLTDDEAFVATTQIVALGAAPVPGGPASTPPAPLPPRASNYVLYYPGCYTGRFGPLFQPMISESILLRAKSIAADTQTAVKAVVTVTDFISGVTAAPVTVKAGSRISIANVGTTLRYTALVTYTDGSVTSTSGVVGSYVPLTNDTNAFTGRGSCKTANGL